MGVSKSDVKKLYEEYDRLLSSEDGAGLANHDQVVSDVSSKYINK